MSDVTKREAHIKYLCHVVNEVQWPQSTCVIALRAEHTTLFHGTPVLLERVSYMVFQSWIFGSSFLKNERRLSL